MTARAVLYNFNAIAPPLYHYDRENEAEFRRAVERWTANAVQTMTSDPLGPSGFPITIDGDGDITIDADVAFTGDVGIGGAITDGTWEGDIIGLAYGGTGANLSATGPGYFKQATLGATVTLGYPSFTEVTGTLAYAQLPTGGGTWANGGTLTITGGTLLVSGGSVNTTNSMSAGLGLTTEAENRLIGVNCGTNAGANDQDCYFQWNRGGVDRWHLGILGGTGAGTALVLRNMVSSYNAFAVADTGIIYTNLGVTTGNIGTALKLNAGTNAGANNKDSAVTYTRGGTDLWAHGVLGSVAANTDWRLYDQVNGVLAIIVAAGATPDMTLGGDLTVPGAVNLAGPVTITSTNDVSLVGLSGSLRIGDTAGFHIAIDGNEIMAKTTPTTTASLGLNSEGGDVHVGIIATSGSPLLGVTANATTENVGGVIKVNCGTNGGANDQSAYFMWERGGTDRWRLGLIGNVDTTGRLVLYDAVRGVTAWEVLTDGIPTATNVSLKLWPHLTTDNLSGNLYINSGTNAGANDKDVSVVYQRDKASLWGHGVLGSIANDSRWMLYDVVNAVSVMEALPVVTGAELRLWPRITTADLNGLLTINAGSNAGANDTNAQIAFAIAGTTTWTAGIRGETATDLAFRIRNVTSGVVALAMDGATGDADFAGRVLADYYRDRISSPAQITANQDNYDPGLFGWLRLSTDASRNITGFTGGAEGRRLVITNVGAQNIVLVEQATSTAANQIITGTGGNITMQPQDTVFANYDSVSSRWRVLSHY